MLRKKINKGSEYVITGFDKILFESEKSEEILRIIRKELAEARKWIPRGLVIFFPIEAELRGEEDNPRLHYNNVDISLRHLFGNRIKRTSISRCFASFDIEK